MHGLQSHLDEFVFRFNRRKENFLGMRPAGGEDVEDK